MILPDGRREPDALERRLDSVQGALLIALRHLRAHNIRLRDAVERIKALEKDRENGR